ncbi:MAG: transposase [Candidatus Aminicenantes bacterium]|nr:transposase [Candidatus Aminicenantes bacterium]
MSRGKLYLIPGLVWHLTQRCHNKDFLLRFSKDRQRWLHWLFCAKKRHRLSILNYAVTSNHVHLLVYNDGRKNIIPRSMLLIASRTAQEYNFRKNRSGAFWEDNYHATAVESGKHLRECLVYIDLNMVRAGVVNHPEDWPFSGYNEIQSNRKRYRLIDMEKLLSLVQIKKQKDFKEIYNDWINSKLDSKDMKRKSSWTESIAVGSENFISKVRTDLKGKAKNRKIIESRGQFILKESLNSYNIVFSMEMSGLSKDKKTYSL